MVPEVGEPVDHDARLRADPTRLIDRDMDRVGDETRSRELFGPRWLRARAVQIGRRDIEDRRPRPPDP
jgi:hypothetical protein